MYGRHDCEIQDEIANRTHEFIFENLSRYDPALASFQRWQILASRNVALRVMTERFNLCKVETGAAGGSALLPLSPWMRSADTGRKDCAGPDEAQFAECRSHLLWKEYDALANDGRLSISLHILQGRTWLILPGSSTCPSSASVGCWTRSSGRLRKRLLRQGFVRSSAKHTTAWSATATPPITMSGLHLRPSRCPSSRSPGPARQRGKTKRRNPEGSAHCRTGAAEAKSEVRYQKLEVRKSGLGALVFLAVLASVLQACKIVVFAEMFLSAAVLRSPSCWQPLSGTVRDDGGTGFGSAGEPASSIRDSSA